MVLLVEAPSEVNPTTSPPESSINKIALTTNLARSTPVNNYNNFILSRYFYSIRIILYYYLLQVHAKQILLLVVLHFLLDFAT